MEAQKKDDEQKKSVPHLWNINEDPALTGMVCHFFPNGKALICLLSLFVASEC